MQLKALAGDSEAEEGAQVDETLDELESGQARTLGAELATVWASSDWQKLSDYRRWCDCVKTATDERALQRLLDDRNPGLARGAAFSPRSARCTGSGPRACRPGWRPGASG